MKIIKKITIFFCVFISLLVGNQALAAPESPWFTGPLLADSGKTIPAGHTNYELYLFYTDNFAQYNDKWSKQTTIDTRIFSPTLIIAQGLSSRFDLKVAIPFDYRRKSGQSDGRFGDLSLDLGYQLLRQKAGSWIPSARLVVGEIFPTGHSENLDPGKRGTDGTGAGSYQTKFAVNLQRLWTLSNGRFLRGRLSTAYTIPHSVRLHNFNAFGGGYNTNGTIHLGNHFSTDLSFEYSLTQHWVPAIDFLYTNSASNRFTGNAGVTATGLPAVISARSRTEFSVAPAIEYNFTSRLGVIVGGWFAIEGRNSADFNAVVFAINYYD